MSTASPPPPANSVQRGVGVNKDLCGVRCERLDGPALKLRCVSGGVEMVIERVYHGSNRWLVEAGGDAHYFADIWTNTFLEYAARLGFDKKCIIDELRRVLAPQNRRATSLTLVIFNQVRDYLPTIGPVLTAIYMDDMGKPRLVMLISQNGILHKKDPSEPLYDDIHDVIYRPRELVERIEKVIDLFPNYPLLNIFYNTRPSIPQLIKEVREVIKNHVTLPGDKYYTALAAYIVAAHFFPVFRYFTVLRIGKPGYNAGGTTTLKVVCSLLPGGRLLVDPSDASYYVLTDMFRLSLCIDEVKTEWGRDKVRKLSFYIDAGFDRDYDIPRMMNGGKDPTFFRLYGPRVIVDPQSLVTSYSNVRRQLVIPVLPARDRREVPSVEKYRELYFELWHKLHAAYLLYADDVKERYDRIAELYPELDGAALQAYGAVLTIASYDEEIREAVLSVVKESIATTEAIKLESDPTKIVLRQVYAKLYDVAERICRYEVDVDDPLKTRIDWRLEDLRRELRESLTELYQIDVKTGEGEAGGQKRIWQRLSDESLDAILGRQPFAALLKQYLSNYIVADKRRYLHLVFENAEEIWRGLEKLASALGIEFTPPCTLSSLIHRNELWRCATDMADATHENPHAVFTELQQNPMRRAQICDARTSEAEPQRQVQQTSTQQQDAHQQMPPRLAVGRCPEGWVYEENTRRCLRPW